jgi:hypothetical protein
MIRPEFSRNFTDTDELIGIFTGGASFNYSVYFIGSYMIEYDGYEPAVERGYRHPLAYIVVAGAIILLIFVVVLRNVYDAV